MKRLSVIFPWSKVEKGHGFFVPCLNIEDMTKRGLNAALASRVLDAKHYPAIKDGLIGVWFYRKRPSS